MDTTFNDEKRKLCTLCGAELVPGGVFCLVCGTNNTEGFKNTVRVLKPVEGTSSSTFQKPPYPDKPVVLSDDFLVPRKREEKKNIKVVIVLVGLILMIILGSIVLIIHMLLR